MLGERRTLDSFVREHLPDALRLATRLTGSVDEAEEVVQEAMLKAVRGWTRFRRQSSFRTWLFRIVINAFHDHVARRHAGPPREWLDDPPDRRGHSPDVRLEQEELQAAVTKAIAALPPRQRAVLVLTTYEHLSTEEIAETLEMSTANVHVTLSAARKRLRQQIQALVVEKSP